MVLSVLVILVAVVKVRAGLDEWVRLRLEARLASMLGAEVSIESLELSLSTLQASFGKVRIRSTEGGGLLTAALERGRLRVSWRALPALPARRWGFARIHLHRPVIEMDRRWFESRRRRGRARPMQWRIDQLEIREGLFRYEDVELPLNLAARQVQVEARWDPERQALVGAISARTQLETTGLSGPLPLAIEGSVLLRGNRFEVVGLQAEAPGVAAEVEEGHVVLEAGAPLAARCNIEAELGRLVPWLPESFASVGGSLRGRIFLNRGEGHFHVGGPIEATHLRMGPLSASRVEGRADLQPHTFTLHGLTADAYGGTINGEVRVDLAPPFRFDTRLEGRDLDSRQLLEITGIRLPSASRGAVELRLAGVATDRATWSGTGRVDMDPADARDGGIPARIGGDFSMDRGRLAIRAARLEAGASRLRLGLEVELAGAVPHGYLTLEGETRDAAQLQSVAESVLASQGVTLPHPLGERVTGHGTVSVGIGLGGEPEFELDLDLRDGSWAGHGFREARLEAGVAETTATIRTLAVSMDGGRLEASGVVRIDEAALDGLSCTLDAIPLGLLSTAVGVRADVEGRLHGELRLVRGPVGLAGEGALRITGLRGFGLSVDEVEAGVEVRGDVATLPDVRASGPGFDARIHVRLDLDSGDGHAVVEEASIDLSRLESLGRLGLEAQGRAILSGAVSTVGGRPEGELRLSGAGWSVAGLELGEVAGTIGVAMDALDFEMHTPRGYGIHMEGRLGLSDGLPVAAVLSLERTPLDLPVGMEGSVWARLTGRLLVQGDLLRLSDFTATGTVETGDLHVGTRVLRIEERLAIDLSKGRLLIGPVRFAGADSELTAQAEYVLENGLIRARLEGAVDLGVVSALSSELRASGPLRVDLQATGSLEQPDLQGLVRIEKGNVRLLGFPESVSDLDLTVRIRGQDAAIEEIRALMGGGEVRGRGRARFEGLRPADYRVDLEAANVRVGYPKGFRAAYEGSLALEGSADAATLRGELRVLRGLYDRKFDIAEIVGYGAREYGSGELLGLPVPVFLDLRLNAPGTVLVRNDLADLEAAFDLRVGGKMERPELTGRLLFFEGGTVRFRDVEYRVRSGSLDFVELGRINPYLNLEAETKVREYEVLLRIRGTLDRLDYQLTSDPALSPQDIIALLTTGRTLEEITGTAGGAGSFTGDVVANYFAGALTQAFERQLEKLLGLERVRINPLLVEGEADPTTRITLGKQVGDTVLLTYSTDVGSNTERDLYQVEWQATRHFRFLADRDTTGGVGGDVRYSRSFWLRNLEGVGRARARDLEASGAEVPFAESVREVHVEGLPEPEQADLLARIVSLRPGERFSRSAVFESAQEIRRFFVNRDRLEARVEARTETAGDEGYDVVYRVNAGPRVVLQLDGVTDKDERRIRRRLKAFWTDSVFRDDLYEQASERILAYLHRRGFYAADLALEQERVGDEHRVRFHVDAGEPVRVASLRIEGATSLAESRIRRQILTGSGGLFSRNVLVPDVLEEDLSAIRNLYREQGFLRARVGPAQVRLLHTGRDADVGIPIEEGPQFTVSSVAAPKGLVFSSRDLTTWAGLETGEVFSPQRLLEAESALRAQLDRRGYPDARIGSEIQVDENRVRVQFSVEPGPLKRVGSVEIRGQRLTKEKVIRRELEFGPGDLLSREDILRSQHRLYQIGVFRSVQIEYEPVDETNPTLQRVVVRVREAPPARFLVGAGYDNEAGPGVSFSVSHANPGGRLRNTALQSRFNDLEKRVQWLVGDPRLFGRKTWSGLGNLLWERRERAAFTEERRSAALRIEKKHKRRWTQYYRYNFQEVDLSDVEDEQVAREQKLENLRLGDVSYVLARDTRDDPFSPTRGGHASSELRLFAPLFLSEQRFAKLFLRGSTVHTFNNGVQFATALRFGAAHPLDAVTRDDGIPLSERFFAGGDSTLRGFPRDGVGPKDDDGIPTGGEALFLLNEEVRFPIWRALKGAVFYDAGNVYQELDDLDPTDLRHVLGVGLRLETPLGPFRIEYGRKLDREEGESSGELFIAIGTAF